MGKNFFNLFGLAKGDKKSEEPFVASLPGNTNEGGTFNPYSGTWAYIKNWAEEELDKCRKKNDISLTMEKTATLRGEIKVLKKILSIQEPVK